MNRLINFFGRKENWPILIIPLLLLAWGQYGAPALALRSFEALTQYEGIYRDPLPAGDEREPVVENVLLIIVDALRVDASLRMPTLERMRVDGADRVVQAGEPSLSLPGWTVMTTGGWQEQNGFASNFVERPVELDSIFQAARRAGLSSSITGPDSYEQLYGGQVDTIVVFVAPEDPYTDLEGVMQQDRDILQAALELDSNLRLVHFISVDNAGHGFGGASAEYEAAAQAVDIHIARLLETVDLETTAVLVTADHGQIDAGGHAGPEPVVIQVPFVSVGAGIEPGSYSPATHADIAPTIAALLGTSFPAHNQGRALLDQIAAAPGLEARIAVDNAEQVSARIESMLSAIGAPPDLDQTSLEEARIALEAGNHDVAVALAFDFMLAADETWQGARAARLNRERLPRLGIALLLLVPAAVYLRWWRSAGWEWRLPWIAALIYTVLWNVNFLFVKGLSYSLSMFNTEEIILPFIEQRVIESLIIVAAFALLIGIIRRGRSHTEVARVTVNTLLAIALLLMAQILVFYVIWNVEFDWYLPNLTLGFKYYMDVFQTTVFWPLLPLPFAAIAPLLAVGVAWLTSLPQRRRQ
jgi:hypothetical protein